jgi:large subunit ribosomal protein L4|tara:strand:- start:785 stop:1405 length:621 start_codon:yes stop_codon:yes gene_type:complete
MKSKVITLENKAAGEIDLADEVFGAPMRKDILARMVNYQLAKRRAGSANTKERSDIRGTTAKPFRQKGTGRARQGSRKAPQMRGGGTAFGPQPRDFAHKLTKKVRRMAMRAALSAKQADGKLVILKDAALKSPKTKELSAMLADLGWSNALVVAGAEVDANLAKAAANIPHIDVLPTQGANVYDILRRDQLVLTTDAVEALEARLK